MTQEQSTVHQPISDGLRRWVAEQTAAGVPTEVLLRAMLDTGWQRGVALAALHAIGGAPGSAAAARRLAGSAAAPIVETVPNATVVAAADVQPLPAAGGGSAAVAVPRLARDDGTHRLNAADRDVQLLLSLREPQLVVFGGLLSDAECDEMVALATLRLARSETVQLDTGDSEVNDARTSDGMFFGREENALCARIEARIAALLGWPIDHGEGLQVLRYRPGAEYKPHYDYFDPAQPGTAAVLCRGGQRVGTLIAYLNTPERGGATTFPDLGLEVAPVKGNAVFFSYDRAEPSTKTLHGGAPLLAGEKWVATKWLREGVFS